MARTSNILIVILNTITMLLAIAAISMSVYFHIHRGSTNCDRMMQKPLLIIGIILFVASLVGMMGSCCKSQFAMILYLVALGLVILGMFAFTVFAFFVIVKDVGKDLSSNGFKEYRLDDYSQWLQRYVLSESNWISIRSCLIDGQICPTLDRETTDASDFYETMLSPIESGCCKPPTSCGYTYKNGTFWEVPTSGPKVTDNDCKTWSNDQAMLCYDCKSCKGGVIENIRKKSKYLVLFNCGVICGVFLLYVVALKACHDNKYDSNKYRRVTRFYTA